MQSTSAVSDVSFRQELRRGQKRALEHPKVLTGQTINVKLPTGYGKTYTACGIYSIRQRHHLASRLLYLVPSRTQLDQFISSGPDELFKASVIGPRQVMDIGYFPNHQILKRHRSNECQIFAATIQYAATGDGHKLCKELIEQGQWMLVIDEYHHYGVEQTWGIRIRELPVNFILALSATPYRPKQDSAFGIPDVAVTYREAVEEGAVKPLRGHAYNYRIDAVDEEGVVKSYTTEELVKEVGSDVPDKIERFRVQKKMRWSPKYVSPLTYIPITRMETARRTTGYKLQALISAMCVSHAELVCSQIKGNFPHLNVDWVGTGMNGRSDTENAEIIKRFCPPKSVNGRGEPEIDVLVHVGMAGEGLDVVNVSEIVLLRTANFNNSTYQIIGRGSRYLPDTNCHVSFDGSTTLAVGEKVKDKPELVITGMGKALEYAMDYTPVLDVDEEDEGDDDEISFPPTLPPEPEIRIQNMELLNIDSGDEGVQTMARLRRATNIAPNDPVDYNAIEKDPNHPDWKIIIRDYTMMREVMAEQYNEKAIIAQWEDAVNGAVSNATGIIIALMRGSGEVRIDKSLIGDIKKRINGRKKAACGPISKEVDVCKLHYNWIVALADQLRKTKQIPSWLQ
jgi:superfamily II DNA or RNA helicase